MQIDFHTNVIAIVCYFLVIFFLKSLFYLLYMLCIRSALAKSVRFTLQAIVVQKLDNAIHQRINVGKTYYAIHRIAIYPVDSYLPFEQLESGVYYN